MDSTGRVHVFLGNISGISATPSATLLAPDGAASQFGRSLAGAGDVNGDGYGDIVIGAPGVMASAGRAYVYLGRSGGPGATPSWTLLAPDGGTFGWSVSGAGDVNGDGYEDVVVAAIGTMPGRAYVYLGNSSGLVGTPGLTLSNPGSTFRFGQSVASAGDVNGDGYADLIVGGAATGSSFGVRAWVYLGGVSGLATTPASTFPPIDGSSSRTLSVAVVGIGDVNGDGYAEVAVTDPESMTYTGRVFVYTGSSTGLDAARSTTLTGSRTGARFGESVAP
jgi:hypothetical protein